MICSTDLIYYDTIRCMCTRLTDEIGLAGVDGVLQLVGGDAELVLGRPVNSDGVVGGGAELVSDGWRGGRYATRKPQHDGSNCYKLSKQ